MTSSVLEERSLNSSGFDYVHIMIPRLHSFVVIAAILASALVSGADSNPFDQSGVPIEVDSSDPKLTKIVLIAGTPSSQSGQHEYFAGCALLMNWLSQTPGVFPVMARDGWPKNEDILRNARALVFFGDGGGKQPFLEPRKWSTVESLVLAGAGLVFLHQAVDFPAARQPEILKWMGGVWLADIGCRGHWDMEFSAKGDHPILRGVKPFKLVNEGWLYNLHFAGTGVTPLLDGLVPEKSRTTKDAKTHAGRSEVVAWAYERPNRGRSFAFTGCDLHGNWAVESQRRFVVNGILWSAGVTIPQEGASVAMATEELRRNLDDKSKVKR